MNTKKTIIWIAVLVIIALLIVVLIYSNQAKPDPDVPHTDENSNVTLQPSSSAQKPESSSPPISTPEKDYPNTGDDLPDDDIVEPSQDPAEGNDPAPTPAGGPDNGDITEPTATATPDPGDEPQDGTGNDPNSGTGSPWSEVIELPDD